MNPLFAYIAPIALLLPAAAVEPAGSADDATQVTPEANLAAPVGPMSTPETFEDGPWQALAIGFLTLTQNQVRIEQTLTIRVSPRPPGAQPIALTDLPQNGMPGRLEERRMGRCLPMSGIIGMQYGGDRRLILFMRDRRVVSATLESACHARDFYSGFYVARNADGMICSDREQLQSRSGANCSIDNFRQLVETDN